MIVERYISEWSHTRCRCLEAPLGPSRSHEPGDDGFILASSKRHYERDRAYLVEHIGLDWVLSFETRSFEGSATLRIRRVSHASTTLKLDAVEFAEVQVELDGARTEFVYDGTNLFVEIPAAFEKGELLVRYRANPRRGMYFVSPDKAVTDRPKQVWTQCQDEEARCIFPCHDKPHMRMTSSLRVTVPGGWTALSNGDLVKKETVHGMSRFTWEMRDAYPSYLFTFVAGAFAELTDTWKHIPLAYYVPKGQEDNARACLGRTPQMMGLFAELFGMAYPWSKYSQIVVADYPGGGMENTTATTLYEHTLLDEKARRDFTSEDLIAHELAHQWFGDFVTCRDFSEGWLNEGFATYAEHLWREFTEGRDAYEYGLYGDLGAYLSEAESRYQRPVVCRDYEAPMEIFDRHLYEKGGLFLHSLRVTLGKDLFFASVTQYLKKFGPGIVETRDLQRVLEGTSGLSLERAFEETIHTAGHADLDCVMSFADGSVRLEVKQTQKVLRHVAISLDLHFQAKVVRQVFELDKKADTFFLPTKERPQFATIDADFRIVGAVRVKAPFDMLRAQLAKAPTARGRYLAAHSLSSSPDRHTLDGLRDRISDEQEFWGTRAECAAVLGEMRGAEAERTLRQCLNVRHLKVLRAVIRALGTFRTRSACHAILPFAGEQDSYFVQAEAIRALGKTRHNDGLEAILLGVKVSSWADVVRSASMEALGELGDPEHAGLLVAATKYGVPTRVRRAAVHALVKLRPDRKTREILEDLLTDHDRNLRSDVVVAIAALKDPDARGALSQVVDAELDPMVRRRIRETLLKLAGDNKDEMRKLRTELESLRGELATIQTHLAELDSKTEKKGESPSKDRPPLPKSSKARAKGAKS